MIEEWRPVVGAEVKNAMTYIGVAAAAVQATLHERLNQEDEEVANAVMSAIQAASRSMAEAEALLARRST